MYGRLYLTEKIGASEFSAEDERLALALAAQVAVAYENALRYDEIQQQAARLQMEVTERKQAEDKLRQSEQKFPVLFEKAAFAVALSRLADGVIPDVNEAFERAFGYTKYEP